VLHIREKKSRETFLKKFEGSRRKRRGRKATEVSRKRVLGEKKPRPAFPIQTQPPGAKKPLRKERG